MTRAEIETLRKEIEKTDEKILELVAQREQIASEIGLVKEKNGLPLRDKIREQRVKSAFARSARRKGVDAVIADALARLLISDSLKIQGARKNKDLIGKTALVVGGSGRMGEWFCRRLSNRGAAVKVWDPRGNVRGYLNVKLLEPAARSADIVVVASPPGVCFNELGMVIDTGPKGLVFDVCSVKSHIMKQLRNAASSGLKIASVHPMFGPSVPSSEGRNVVLCDCGNLEATNLARRLFSTAGANVVEVSLERHDELMEYVLGLPHLCSLLFGHTLVKSGEKLSELQRAQGPSFARMVKASQEVSGESVRVYHDIQALNPHTRRLLTRLEDVASELSKASVDDDPARFRIIMESIRKYLGVR